MNIFGIGLIVLQLQTAQANGMVTKPGGNEPLPGARVTLSPVASGQSLRARSVVTEEDGRFTIEGIEPGEYRLHVQSVRYGQAAYGQRKPDGPGTILSIAEGKRIPDLRISMIPTGTIAGRVTGRDGEPVVYAAVQALKHVYQDGKRVLTAVQTATTDDRGEFRLFWLPGGTYLVAAAARNTTMPTAAGRPLRPGETTQIQLEMPAGLSLIMLTGSILESATVTRILEDGTVQEESWMPVYHPAATDPAQASPVEVTAGATSSGIDIRVGPSRVQKVRGRVLGFTPGSQATVALTPTAWGVPGYMTSKGASTLDGSFEFAGIGPGEYHLTAQDRSGLVAAPVTVLVGDRDVENLSIGLSPGVSLSGRVILEGVAQNPGDPNPLTGLTISLRPELDGAVLRSILGPPLSGNVLTWTNVPPGNYQLSFSQGVLQPNQKPLHVKSVRLGRADATDTISISGNTSDTLEVVLTSETGSVEGVAIGSSTGPATGSAAGATVVLVPANARKRSALYKVVVTGADGRFRFQDIPPGDYKLFAWDDVETGAWQNADFIRPYESRGRAVRVSENSVSENSNVNVQLNVIYRR